MLIGTPEPEGPGVAESCEMGESAGAEKIQFETVVYRSCPAAVIAAVAASVASVAAVLPYLCSFAGQAAAAAATAAVAAAAVVE